jgi:4-aminobutyrate aminotransferase/(S)-3-amino-2-methylpropionate transaminase
VACAAALGAIETMETHDLCAAARRLGAVMTGALTDMAGRHDVIGDVRGRGAMVAVELVRPGTREPDPARTAAVAKACHAEGVVVLTCGTFGNVIRLLPPLVMPEALLAEGLDVLDKAFSDTAS